MAETTKEYKQKAETSGKEFSMTKLHAYKFWRDHVKVWEQNTNTKSSFYEYSKTMKILTSKELRNNKSLYRFPEQMWAIAEKTGDVKATMAALKAIESVKDYQQRSVADLLKRLAETSKTEGTLAQKVDWAAGVIIDYGASFNIEKIIEMNRLLYESYGKGRAGGVAMEKEWSKFFSGLDKDTSLTESAKVLEQKERLLESMKTGPIVWMCEGWAFSHKLELPSSRDREEYIKFAKKNIPYKHIAEYQMGMEL